MPSEKFSFSLKSSKQNRFHDLATFIETGQPDINQWLAQNKIENPHMLRGNKGETVLHIAVTTGILESVRYWLEKGMDPNFADKFGRNSLHYAAKSGKNVVEMTRFLLGHGTDINSTDNENNTMGHHLPGNPNVTPYVFEKWTNLVVESGHAELFKIQNKSDDSIIHYAMGMLDVTTSALSLILSDPSIDVNQLNEFNNTPLMLGALYGRKQNILQLLVEKGSDYNLSNNEKRGILHHCVEGDNVEGLKYFVSLGCDVNARSIQEDVPHHRLRHSRKRFKELTEVVLQSGANLHATNRKGSNVAHVISQNKNISPREYRKWVEQMVDLGHSHIFKQKNFDGNTPLHCAMCTFDVDRRTLQLFQTKCGMDMNQKDSDGNTLLLLAVQNGRSNVTLHGIVALGGDLNISNNRKRGVLHLAVANANIYALQLFLQRHVNVEAKDDTGETPFHKIRYSESKLVELTSILLRKEANLYETDKDGNTVAHLLGNKVSFFVYKKWAKFVIREGHSKIFELQNASGELPKSI